MQARRRQSDNLVASGLVYVAVTCEKLLFEQQVPQLLHITHRGGDLDLGERGLAVTGLHQGGHLGSPDARTRHAFLPLAHKSLKSIVAHRYKKNA